jgi:hypothetical protein
LLEVSEVPVSSVCLFTIGSAPIFFWLRRLRVALHRSLCGIVVNFFEYASFTVGKPKQREVHEKHFPIVATRGHTDRLPIYEFSPR